MDKSRRRRPILGRVAYPTPNTRGPRVCPASILPHCTGQPPASHTVNRTVPEPPASIAGPIARTPAAAVARQRRSLSMASRGMPLRELHLPASISAPHANLRARREASPPVPRWCTATADIHMPSPIIDDSCGPPASLGSHCSAKTPGTRPNRDVGSDQKSKTTTCFGLVLCLAEARCASTI